MPLTPGTPLDVLVERLARAGWGDLGEPELRGCGVVLEALARVLPARSAAGKVTAPQLAARCRYTERWVRRCLTLLEDLEVITWERGGIVAGSPVPSWVRVSKAVLVDLIHIARAEESERLIGQARETRARVARLRGSYTRRHGSKQGTSSGSRAHPELVTALRSTEEGPGTHGPAGGCATAREAIYDEAPASTDTARSALARIRADLAARRRGGPAQAQQQDEPAHIAVRA